MLSTIIFLFVTSALLTWIFFIVFKNPGPWNSFWVLLTVLFLIMFGFILWVPPVGPVWYDIAWLDAILCGVVIALLIGATSEKKSDFPKNQKGEVDLVAAAESESANFSIFGLFFWSFIITISVIIIFGIIHKINVSG